MIAGNFSFRNLKEELITVTHYVNNKKQTIYIDDYVMDNIELLIKNIIERIMTENFVQTKDKKRCEYCDYRLICNR